MTMRKPHVHERHLLIIDPRKLIANCLRTLFQAEHFFHNILIAPTLETALPMIAGTGKWVVILAGHSCPSVQRMGETLRKMFKEARIIILAAHPCHCSGLTAVHSHAHGYWTFHDDSEDLVVGVLQVAEGNCTISPHTRHFLHTDEETLKFHGELPEKGFHKLTRREKECFLQLVKHPNTEDCASRLGICAKTVQNFKYRIMRKLDARSVAELVHYGFRHALVDVHRDGETLGAVE